MGRRSETGSNLVREKRPTPFGAFMERYAEDAAEAAWLAALAWADRALERSREAPFGRWRYNPAGELRRLRRELVGALLLARFAVACQEEENAYMRSLTAELEERATAAAARTRREQTLEAERVRLLRARARREGREPSDEELYWHEGGPGV